MIILILSLICTDIIKENVLIYSINSDDDNFFYIFNVISQIMLILKKK